MREDEYREYTSMMARNSRLTKVIITVWIIIVVITALILILSSCAPVPTNYVEANSVGAHDSNYVIDRVEYPQDSVVCYVANNGYVGGSAELDIDCVDKGR